MKRHVERQRGAILVMTVLFLVILLGFAALALDLGRLYVLRTEMQNAADAAALAAAAELDGRTNSRSDAVIAAKQLLSHRGRFATQSELLTQLKYDPDDSPQNNAFEFYSWINAELDPASKPAGCTNPLSDAGVADTNKCLAEGDNDAHYIKVKLYPELVVDEEEYFQISLYFLPVLGLFVEDGTALTASTRVNAVAGAGGPVFCQYPPMFMCAFDEEADYPGIEIGQQVKVKSKDASTPWGPGNVGFLQVAEDIEVPLDNGNILLEKNVDAMSAALGNEFIRQECDPAIVSTQTGVITQKTRQALNTRFGLYETYDNAKQAFPPAPNTVDYPLDDIFSVESPEYVTGAKKGDGWLNNATECLVGSTPPPPAECENSSHTTAYTRPETFSSEDYISHYHSTPPTTTYDSRYALYNWELQSILNMPGLSLNPGEVPLDNRNSSSQEDCSQRSVNSPGSKYCMLHNGEPLDGDPSLGDAKRRVLRVAVIKCSKYNISGNTPNIDLSPDDPDDPFPFHEFFLTQHAQAASSTEFFIEYIGPVSEQQEIEKIRHSIIQLYE